MHTVTLATINVILFGQSRKKKNTYSLVEIQILQAVINYCAVFDTKMSYIPSIGL